MCGSMRLDKFICKGTELTKTQADELILEGRVKINSDVVTLESTQVHENNQVTLNGKELVARPFRYILMNKPANTICSNVDEVYPSVLHFLDVDKAFDLHIAGRLDADTTGLVLITDDGRWSHNVISPKKDCSKTYRVWLRNAINDDNADELILHFRDDTSAFDGEKMTQLSRKGMVNNCFNTQLLLANRLVVNIVAFTL